MELYYWTLNKLQQPGWRWLPVSLVIGALVLVDTAPVPWDSDVVKFAGHTAFVTKTHCAVLAKKCTYDLYVEAHPLGIYEEYTLQNVKEKYLRPYSDTP